MNLFVFYSDESLTYTSLNAGVNGVVIDWENAEKRVRQSLFNTQINKHDLHTLQKARAMTEKQIICRVNGSENLSGDEIKKALDYGADRIMVPMISTIDQVEKALGFIDGKAETIIMIETLKSIDLAEELGKMDVDYFYVGLNDLAIDRGERNIFMPLADGTIDQLRSNIRTSIGVAGLTHPEKGYPIPSSLLINELVRLECDFTFLRRSFFKDALQYGVKETIDAIRMAIQNRQVFDEAMSKEFRDLVISTPVITI